MAWNTQTSAPAAPWHFGASGTFGPNKGKGGTPADAGKNALGGKDKGCKGEPMGGKPTGKDNGGGAGKAKGGYEYYLAPTGGKSTGKDNGGWAGKDNSDAPEVLAAVGGKPTMATVRRLQSVESNHGGWGAAAPIGGKPTGKYNGGDNERWGGAAPIGGKPTGKVNAEDAGWGQVASLGGKPAGKDNGCLGKAAPSGAKGKAYMSWGVGPGGKGDKPTGKDNDGWWPAPPEVKGKGSTWQNGVDNLPKGAVVPKGGGKGAMAGPMLAEDFAAGLSNRKIPPTAGRRAPVRGARAPAGRGKGAAAAAAARGNRTTTSETYCHSMGYYGRMARDDYFEIFESLSNCWNPFVTENYSNRQLSRMLAFTFEKKLGDKVMHMNRKRHVSCVQQCSLNRRNY